MKENERREPFGGTLGGQRITVMYLTTRGVRVGFLDFWSRHLERIVRLKDFK